jgi:DNA polymerase III subunit delta'
MRFEEIPGNQKVKADLIRRVVNNNLPHAQLFTGPNGNAKLTLALALAQYLVCTDPSSTDNCGVCPSCIKAAKYVHPDIHFSFPVISAKSGDKPVSTDYYPQWRKALIENPYIDYQDWMKLISKENKQGNITKEECRSIISKLSLKAFEGKNKILIMWLPEYLGKEGNALLKLIEEPPEATYFILVTDAIDAILPTILSRTQLLKTNSFAADDIYKYANKDGFIEASLMDQIVFMADGSLSKALQLIGNTQDDLSAVFKEWMRLCYSRNILDTGKWCNQTAAIGREELKNFFNNSLHVLRECLLLKIIENYQTKVPQNQADFVKNFSRNLDAEAIEELYIIINDSIYEVERNANAKIMLFDISLKIQDIFEGAKKRLVI